MFVRMISKSRAVPSSAFDAGKIGGFKYVSTFAVLSLGSHLQNCMTYHQTKGIGRGVGGKSKTVANCHPSVSNSAWESIFQMNVDCYFTDLGLLNISKYLARYCIQMDPSVTERRQLSGKKPVLCMLGLLSTNIRGRERSD